MGDSDLLGLAHLDASDVRGWSATKGNDVLLEMGEILCSARGRALTSSAREQSSMGRDPLARTNSFSGL
jgi:hypothetical protein